MSTATALRPRRLPTPATEPPYDGPEPRPQISPLQGTLPLEFRAGPPRPTLRLVPDPDEGGEDEGRTPGRYFAESIAHGIAEILAGTRPATQFRQWCTPEVFAAVGRRGALVYREGSTVRRAATGPVHICRPSASVVEASTVLHGPERPRALAFRLEARGPRWVCTALELG